MLYYGDLEGSKLVCSNIRIGEFGDENYQDVLCSNTQLLEYLSGVKVRTGIDSKVLILLNLKN